MSFMEATGDLLTFLALAIVAILESIVRLFIPAKYKMKSIAGEIALVTGGGGGLGRLISLRLANLGAIVVVWDVNKAGMEETVKLVQAAGGTCYGYVCDLCDREDVYKKAKVIKEEVGEVTILINNAGVAGGMNLMDTPDKQIIRTMDVNVMSHFWTAKAFLPSMMKNDKGHIVSIASLAGQIGVPRLVDYCTSKFAAVGFEEALHMELKADGYNIHTTVVCPFFIRNTGMFEDAESRFVQKLSPNEVAERVVTGMRCNEKIVIVPGYLQALLIGKWIFPWTCAVMFIRSILGQPARATTMPSIPPVGKASVPNVLSKEQNGVNIHHQLTRRISSSERKP